MLRRTRPVSRTEPTRDTVTAAGTVRGLHGVVLDALLGTGVLDVDVFDRAAARNGGRPVGHTA